jgi:hypothetical protein
MTEQEWLECTEPKPMLEFLWGKVPERKATLFAAACCRHIWHLLTDERLRRLVEVSEQVADDLAPWEDLYYSGEWAYDLIQQAITTRPRAFWSGDQFAHIKAASNLTDCHQRGEEPDCWGPAFVSQAAVLAVAYATDNPATPWLQREEDYYAHMAAESQAQALLLRDIFGNPFRPVRFDPAWATPAVLSVARAIYEERRFVDLPVLADALEEAGCTNADILDHCRSGGEHVLGCWAVDLVLARQ